jgi:uncharacterized protein YndB with AHSA1/START domain
MEIDIAHYIVAVTRNVGDRAHDGRRARVIVASCTYDTTIQDLWDAITNVERIPRWFLPISGDLRLGGRFRLEGNASGEILHCEAPRRVKMTWESAGGISWLEVRLIEEPGGGTRLELEHTAHVDDERWGQYGPGAVGVGWDCTLLGLDLHISSGATVDRQRVAAWSASGEGKEYMRRSSEQWCNASIRAGTDEAAARAAADRTTAFYTGVPTTSVQRSADR